MGGEGPTRFVRSVMRISASKVKRKTFLSFGQPLAVGARRRCITRSCPSLLLSICDRRDKRQQGHLRHVCRGQSTGRTMAGEGVAVGGPKGRGWRRLALEAAAAATVAGAACGRRNDLQVNQETDGWWGHLDSRWSPRDPSGMCQAGTRAGYGTITATSLEGPLVPPQAVLARTRT